MAPHSLNIPTLGEPYDVALAGCFRHAFATYEVVGLLVTGTIVRGSPDRRSDLDVHVLHSGNFRERVQLRFNGVPCEIFVNPPHRIPAYFEEDRIDRRPIAPDMFASGVIVLDSTGIVGKLVEQAKSILGDPPPAPDENASVQIRYSAATEFEDVLDLADRDPGSAAVLLGATVRKLAECRVSLAPGWLPRAKDLMTRLDEVDPVAAHLARRAVSDLPFSDRLAIARSLCLHVTGAEEFFEWTSPRETVGDSC
jgi:hypothetical protein